MSNWWSVAVIDLEDYYEQQPDTRDIEKFLELM
jgi:hypothetical protein